MVGALSTITNGWGPTKRVRIVRLERMHPDALLGHGRNAHRSQRRPLDHRGIAVFLARPDSCVVLAKDWCSSPCALKIANRAAMAAIATSRVAITSPPPESALTCSCSIRSIRGAQLHEFAMDPAITTPQALPLATQCGSGRLQIGADRVIDLQELDGRAVDLDKCDAHS